MELDMKKFSDLKALTCLTQFGPKVFGKGLIKPLVKNPSSKFYKQDLIFSRMVKLIQ